MITRDLVEPIVPSGRAAITGDDGWLRCAPIERAKAEEFLRTSQFSIGGEWRRLSECEYQLVPVPTCQCCGAIASTSWASGQARCGRHFERNPCAIEGCTHSRSIPDGGQRSSDDWLCSAHWRRFCPPRSLRRRAYHAFFRQAKRHGWDFMPTGARCNLNAQFWRFWAQLIATARAKAEGGSIDRAAIDKLFGWASEGAL